MRSGQHWSMIIKQAMEANTIELDPSGQELEGRRTIAGEISSVNHRTPCPSAPPIEGRVKSNDQKRQSKSEIDKRYNENRKQKEDEIMKELESLDKISGELERENDKLEWQENQLEVTVYEEYRKIVSLLEDNNAGQNTDVQGASAHAGFPDANADINTSGEISMGHDGLNGLKREMNQAPITSSTFSRENASMNLQLAGSSGLTDMREKKRIADKKCREKKKRKINEAQERIKEHQRKNHKLMLQKVKSKAKATQLQKQLAQYRNISALMTSKNARRNALLEQLVLNDRVLQNSGQGSTPFNTQLQNTGQGSTSFSTQLPCFDIGDQGNTSFHEDLNWFLDGYNASVERHKPEIELVEVAAMRAAHDPELENERQSLVDPVFDVDDLLVMF
uniref:BZIP domain-containing protein n=1 Tax=Populus trichocarpa TaxID=3694 RepID=A0A3N7FXL5_POPTR